MTDKMEVKKKRIRDNIQFLIDDSKLDEAMSLINEYLKINSGDLEMYSMKAVILIMQRNMNKSEKVLKEGLAIDNYNFDLNYNLAYLYEQEEKFSDAVEYYRKAFENCSDENIKADINALIEKIFSEHKIVPIKNKKKIVFFVMEGMDRFLEDIINGVSDEYETQKIIAKESTQIDKGMKWADICWFEWCDELIGYGSKLSIAKEKIIICRLHSYEAFTEYPSNVNWKNIDRIIFIAEHIKNFVIDKFKIDKHKSLVISNGIDLEEYTFDERKKGFNIAYAGYINYKKGPMLLLHTFKAILKKDSRYKFYIAGKFTDDRYELYFQQMIRELGLEKNFIFDGWQDDLNKWLEDKNFILCTSVLESQNISVMQAMTKGIKPIVHNFVGAKSIYPNKYIWNTIDEAIDMISETGYDSYEYRKFIEDNYSLEKQINDVIRCFKGIEIGNEENIESFDYQNYWNNRLNSKFDIEGVGYIGLGTIYNQYLYKNRLDMVDYIFKNIIKANKELSVLELGPGIGMFTEYFHSVSVKNYEAIDISEKSVHELSRKYNKYKFTNADISKLEHYNKKYDFIFAADVLLHVTNENNYKATISNISKSLKDHGTCILMDPISVLNTKSESDHVVIRDKNYIENILKNNDLELVQMLPVAFFMNYPFDKELLGNNGETAINLFNLISHIFSNVGLSDKEKEMLCNYLINKERQLLIDKNFGLSEKLIIVKKKSNKDKNNLVRINDIWNKTELVKEEELILKEKNNSISNYLDNLKNLISKFYN